VAMRVAGPFGLPVPDYPPLLRLHLRFIEPDVQISGIRLSDQTHPFAHSRHWRVHRSCVRPNCSWIRLFIHVVILDVWCGRPARRKLESKRRSVADPEARMRP
jgi:hypothetical protein